MMKWSLALMYILPTVFLSAQANLIPNGGFEEYRHCPQSLSDFDAVLKNWYIPNVNSTPNYYHSCAGGTDVGVPVNYFGTKKAINGQAYVGIMTSNTYREYIAIQFNQPLKKGQSYRLSFYTSIVKKQTCNSKGLDVYFAPITGADFNTLGQCTNAPTLRFNIDYSNENWIFSEQCFTSTGDEQILLIGDLSYPTANHDCKDGDISYFFIDDVSLIEAAPAQPEPIKINSCNRSFPLLLDASKITGLQTLSPTQWNWDGVFSSAQRIAEKKGIYKLTAYVSKCETREYLIEVSDTVDCQSRIFAPNVFTPNDDGFNDEWKIESTGIRIVQLIIADRSGAILYQSFNSNPSWDGQSGNKKLTSGVYVYKLYYTSSAENQIKTTFGTITLIR